MADQITNLSRRRVQISQEIAQAVSEDVDAVLRGLRPHNTDRILRLGQEINILDAALRRVNNVETR
ncbi:hypothetical protein [Sinorhizobium meliloti]|uniref:hypothetical protein n=1 Tax=Rhizobium meliloti TaxID=382 RepID=UPI003F19002A